MFRLMTLIFATFLTLSPDARAASHHHHTHDQSIELNKGPSAPPITANSINAASFKSGGTGQDPALIIKAEVLLDRDHFSPGQIDGENGDNFKKALAAFEQAQGLPPTGQIDADAWKRLAPDGSDTVLKQYKISDPDVAGPFDKRIPSDLVHMSKLPGLSYKTPREELAEKFHMSEALLVKLNPDTRFDRAGTQIVVADVVPLELRTEKHAVEIGKPSEKDRQPARAVTVVVDKPARDVRAYDTDGKLLAFYPATIGSAEKPAPTGTFSVRGVDWNPIYHYDPKFAWKGVKTHRKLTVRPGPNNPVGLVWIDLSAPSYGIHGTPDPEKIGKTESHGCIRLTNWDAVDLAGLVRRGTKVKFEDRDSPVATLSAPQATDTAQTPAAADKATAKAR